MKNSFKNDCEIYNYEISLQKNGKIFQVSIKSLNLFSYGKDLDEAMKNLNIEFKKLKLNYKNFKMLDKLKDQNSVSSNYFFRDKTIFFIIKTSIIAFIFVLSFVFLTSFVTNKISQISFVEILKTESNKLKYYLNNKDDNLIRFKNFLKDIEHYINELQNLNK